MYLVDPICAGYVDEFIITGIIVNTTLALASIVLIVIGILNATRVNANSFIAKVEKRMVLYTLVSSILIIAWFGSIYLSFQIPSMFEFFDNLSVFLFLIQHYPPMVVLVMVK
uniref:G_PROTEIN_RECEP_F1_2 domain-containing protein n=1 Tax=Panagrellus redivivus TaxID=6233 RepID=A0A7E4ZUP6_PANRE